MPTRTSKTGSELFIIDNSDADWKVRKYLHDWCQLTGRPVGVLQLAYARPCGSDDVLA